MMGGVVIEAKVGVPLLLVAAMLPETRLPKHVSVLPSDTLTLYHLTRWAAEIKLRAERRAGELLKEMGLKPGPKSSQVASNSLPSEITWSQSSRWQQVATLPEEQGSHVKAV